MRGALGWKGRGTRGQPKKYVRTHTHKLKPLNHLTVVPQPQSTLRFNKLRITRMHGQAWRRSRYAVRHGATVLLLCAFVFRRATPSRAPCLGVFRVVDGVGRMFDLVFFDVTVGNCMNADRQLATLARAIWFGTLCGEVPRLVTIVTNISPIGLRRSRPRGRRGANRCERSFRRCPLVLCRVSDFDCRWASHLELQAQLVDAVPIHLGGSNSLGKSPIRELVIQDPHVL